MLVKLLFFTFFAVICCNEVAVAFEVPWTDPLLRKDCNTTNSDLDLGITIECGQSGLVIDQSARTDDNLFAFYYICTNSADETVQDGELPNAMGWAQEQNQDYFVPREMGAAACQVFACYEDGNFNHFTQNLSCTFNQDDVQAIAEPPGTTTALEILPSTSVTTSDHLTSRERSPTEITGTLDVLTHHENTANSKSTTVAVVVPATTTPQVVQSTVVEAPMLSEPTLKNYPPSAQISPTPVTPPPEDAPRVSVAAIVTSVLIVTGAAAILLVASCIVFCISTRRRKYKRPSANALEDILDMGDDDKIDPYFMDVTNSGLSYAGSLHSIFNTLTYEEPEKLEQKKSKSTTNISTLVSEAIEDTSNNSSVFIKETSEQNEVEKSQTASFANSVTIEPANPEVPQSGYVAETSQNILRNPIRVPDEDDCSLTESTGSEPLGSLREAVIGPPTTAVPSGYVDHSLTSQFSNTPPPSVLPQTSSKIAPVPAWSRLDEQRKRAIQPIMSVSSCSSGYVSEYAAGDSSTSQLRQFSSGNGSDANTHHLRQYSSNVNDATTQLHLPIEAAPPTLTGYIEAAGSNKDGGRCNDTSLGNDIDIWCNNYSDDEQLDEGTSNSKALGILEEAAHTTTTSYFTHHHQLSDEQSAMASASMASSIASSSLNLDLPASSESGTENGEDLSSVYYKFGLTLDPDLFDPIESDISESESCEDYYSTELNDETETPIREETMIIEEDEETLKLRGKVGHIKPHQACHFIPSLLSPPVAQNSFTKSEESLNHAKFYFPR